MKYLVAALLLLSSSTVWAMDNSHHGHDSHGSGHSGHADMESHAGHGAPTAKQGEGIGTLNKVDVTGKKINLTHGPIAALNWPEMTMDLAVSKRVRLAEFKAGEKVRFTLKLGRDKNYRVVKMEKVADSADDGHQHHHH